MTSPDRARIDAALAMLTAGIAGDRELRQIASQGFATQGEAVGTFLWLFKSLIESIAVLLGVTPIEALRTVALRIHEDDPERS